MKTAGLVLQELFAGSTFTQQHMPQNWTQLYTCVYVCMNVLYIRIYMKGWHVHGHALFRHRSTIVDECHVKNYLLWQTSGNMYMWALG